MMKNIKKGFTLIELLVVIAIIGILASVVLASLNTARDKAANAAIKSNLNNTRAQAELFYDGTQTYTGACANANIEAARAAADSANGAGAATCFAGVTRWAMEAALKVGEGAGATLDWYCVDSSGTASLQTDPTTTATDCGCGATTPTCA